MIGEGGGWGSGFSIATAPAGRLEQVGDTIFRIFRACFASFFLTGLQDLHDFQDFWMAAARQD